MVNTDFLAQVALHVPPDVALLCVAGHCYYQLSLFFLSLSLSLYLYVFCFWPTSGKLRRLKVCFTQHFGITIRYMYKKYILLSNSYIYTKKKSDLRPAFHHSCPFLVQSPNETEIVKYIMYIQMGQNFNICSVLPGAGPNSDGFLVPTNQAKINWILNLSWSWHSSAPACLNNFTALEF